MRRRYVVAEVSSQFVLMDVILITKLLKNGKLLKLYYLAEDSKDLKLDVEVIKVLTVDSEDSEYSKNNEDLKSDY